LGFSLQGISAVIELSPEDLPKRISWMKVFISFVVKHFVGSVSGSGSDNNW